MARKVFSKNALLTVEKFSSEKIKIIPTSQNLKEKTEAWVIIIRQQFYPFRARELRDQWFQQLSCLQDSDIQGYLGDEELEPTRISSAWIPALQVIEWRIQWTQA